MPTKNEILQASLTIASIAVALAVVLPSFAPFGPVLAFDLGSAHREIPFIPTVMLVSGLLALAAGIRALDEIRREHGLSIPQFFQVSGSSLGLLVAAMFMLGGTYIVVLWGLADRAKVVTP